MGPVVEDLRGRPREVVILLDPIPEVERKGVRRDPDGRGVRLRPLGDHLVRIVEADVPHIGLLRVRGAAPTGRRVERQVVQAAVRRQHEIGRDVTLVRLHDDQYRAPVRSCRSGTDLPPLRVPRDATQDDLAGLELDDTGAEHRAGQRRLRVAVGEGQEVALHDGAGDPTHLVLAGRGRDRIRGLPWRRRVAVGPSRIRRGRGCQPRTGKPLLLLGPPWRGHGHRDDERRVEAAGRTSSYRHHGFTP